MKVVLHEASSELAAAGVVGGGHVREAGERRLVGTDERVHTRQVDVITNEEQSAGAKPAADPTRGIREQHDRTAEPGEQSEADVRTTVQVTRRSPDAQTRNPPEEARRVGGLLERVLLGAHRRR